MSRFFSFCTQGAPMDYRGNHTRPSLLLFLIEIKKARTSLASLVFVPRVGIEPTRPKTHDFESCASTNSAT